VLKSRALLSFVMVLVLHGCGPAWSPVETRPVAGSSYELTDDGHYRVRRGDSLYTIAFTFGLDWRDLAEWNGIGSPYTIYPDQTVRLSPPPSAEAGSVVTHAARTPAPALTTEAQSGGEVSAGAGARKEAEGAAAGPVAAAPATDAERSVAGPPADPTAWLWPTEGRLLSTFRANDPSRNGIEIGGDEGQPVVAAAAGQVVYSGSGLIGYGELIIIKHSDRMLSAYAHNRRRLVSEGQRVAAGEQLAEMGRDDRNQAMLHFEIRVHGTPQDPMKYLPRR